MTNTDFRETLSGEFAQFYAAHEQDRSLLRFHYHKLDQIWQSLRDLSLPRRAYSSEMTAVPELARFITEDEIDHALDRGSGVEGGKGRIYEYFTADHTGKEKAAFLKDEYGIGGRSHAVSGASHSGENHDSRGITLKKADCANVELSWTKVAARIDSLIQKDRFLSPREMNANHQSQQYRLEDNILRHFPAQIEENRGFLSGFEADMKTLEAHPHPKDGFAGMEVKGDLLTDKDNAGAALLEAFKDAKGLEPVPIGSYRGFAMSLTVENFGKDFILTLKGRMSHRVELGKDARGNLVRIDNALAQMPERYKTVQGRLENVQAQLATAKAELGKPFPQEAELKEKSARLAELNAELNIDDRTPMEQAAENVVAKRPSVLGKLKVPSVHGAGDRKKSHEQEARRV